MLHSHTMATVQPAVLSKALKKYIKYIHIITGSVLVLTCSKGYC